jgi:hypothetical protein
VFSVLSLCASLVPVHLLTAKGEIANAYDEDMQSLVLKTITQMIILVPTNSDVFIGTVFNLDEAHSKLIPESVFRDFLEDVYLGVRYTDSSLLNILVQVAFGALRCWMVKMPKRLPG